MANENNAGQQLMYVVLMSQGPDGNLVPVKSDPSNGQIGGSSIIIPVPVVQGGTGLSSLSAGDLWYGSGVNTAAKLAISAQNRILTVDSTGIPAWKVRSIFYPLTGALTILPADDGTIFSCTAGGSGYTVTLPDVANVPIGFEVTISKADSAAGLITIATTGGQLINGATNNVLNSQYSHVKVISNGTSWYVKDAFDIIQGVLAAAAYTVVTNTYETLSSISLGAGTWDISAQAMFQPNAQTFNDVSGLSISTVAASAGVTGDTDLAHYPVLSQSHSITIAPKRVSLTATTIYYASTRSNWSSGGKPLRSGRISATRVK